MILLKISNSSELIASKVGQFVERLTADNLDHSTVGAQVIKTTVRNLGEEGGKGEISSVHVLGVNKTRLLLNDGLNIRTNREF